MLTSTKDDEFQRLPEGDYTFTITKEPEGRKKTNPRTGKDYKYFIFKLTAVNDSGESFNYSTILVPWGSLWRTLLKALGGTPDDKGEIHLSETDVVGKEFRGTVEYQDHPNKPGEIIDKLTSIEYSEDDDVPF